MPQKIRKGLFPIVHALLSLTVPEVVGGMEVVDACGFVRGESDLIASKPHRGSVEIYITWSRSPWSC